MKSILSKISRAIGINNGEVVVALIIVFGLAIGLFNTYILSPSKESSNKEDIYKLLDDIAEKQKTTYTGSDISDNPRSELASGDSIYEKPIDYPQKTEDKQLVFKININTASKVELQKLPGVGYKTAIKIINYRLDNTFTKASDIMRIKGIGKKKFYKMKDFIEVQK